MTTDAEQNTVSLARLAGLELPSDRLAALQFGVSAQRAAIAALMAREYGESEPAARFRPRPSR